MIVEDLGTVGYEKAWELQELAHRAVLAQGEERLLLVEHPPVITFGRRGRDPGHVVASEEELRRLGVAAVDSDRGGDVTFHGPGQVVAYPIVRLGDHGLSVGGYVRRLQEAVIAALARFGIAGQADGRAIGVWVGEGAGVAKICALGVRIRRGVSTHGIALNVETDLSYFRLIVPCGLAGREVTSMRKVLGEATPSMERVKGVVAEELVAALGGNK
jgi:lipoyl(octanoyl) transferase